MRFLTLFAFFLIIVGCGGETVNIEDLDNLNGYWEIEKVVFPDGNSKKYEISTTIDYIEYANLKGFRKKVQPNLNGTFNTSNDAEFFTIVPKNNTFIIQYSNELSSWEEKVRVLSKSQLIVSNDQNLIYHYKRYESKSHEK